MIHFLYKVTHLPTGRYYLGKRSTKKLNDGYLGSGVAWKNILVAHPVEEFQRVILSYHESKTENALAEKKLITSELLKDPLCMNLIEGGHGGGPENFYKNSSPTENARRAAATLKSNPDRLLERNKKVSVAHSQMTNRALEKVVHMRSFVTEESRKKQGIALRESNAKRKHKLLLALEQHGQRPVNELTLLFSVSRSTIYRMLSILKSSASANMDAK